LANGKPISAQEIPMKSTLIPALLLAGGISLATVACSKNDNAADTGATAGDTASPGATATGVAAASDHASQFLTDVIQTNNAEIKFGQAAQDMGSSQAVKDFGKMLVDDHTKANEEAVRLANSMGVVVPAGIKPDDMAAYNKAAGMSGAAFDEEFAADMVKGHQAAIDKFQQEADSTDPAPLTDFARQTLPTLKKHLETAQSLQK
jgi:putative membrane protein